MGKKNTQSDFKKRKKGSDKKKNTFKKYGKNTQRGLRIKAAELEKKAIKRKNEGNHIIVGCKTTGKQNKNMGRQYHGKKMCEITCRNKKHGGK